LIKRKNSQIFIPAAAKSRIKACPGLDPGSGMTDREYLSREKSKMSGFTTALFVVMLLYGWLDRCPSLLIF